MRETTATPPTQGDPHLQDFLRSLSRADLSAVTIRGYKHDLDGFLRWFAEAQGKAARLEQLTHVDLVNYRQHLVTVKRLRPATVNRRLQALRGWTRWAHRQDLLKTNVGEEVKRIRSAPRRRPMGLLESEVHALLRSAGESKRGLAKRNYALVQLLLQTGLRVGEVAGLSVGDTVVHDRVGAVRVRQGKGRKEREVPLNASARRALRSYLGTRETPQPQDPLFADTQGDRLSIRAIQHAVTSLARRAKITRINASAHTLRHTFALNYLRQNPGKLVELASLMGHDSLDTTAIYTQPSTEELTEDLERSRLNIYG